MALNHMLDRMGGMQIRMWNVLPNSEKKTTLHQAAREQGYKFIRDHGPRSNNSNQFMEWTDERVHLPGGKLEGWQEGKVKEAFNTCFRGRQKAKTIVLAVYLEKLCGMVVGWRFGQNLTDHATARSHGLAGPGLANRLGQKLLTILFMQSRFEIAQAARNDLVPSSVTGKHLDFFKAEPLTKFQPGVFDDGMLHRMDASFDKAFLNPSATRSLMQNKVFLCIFLRLNHWLWLHL